MAEHEQQITNRAYKYGLSIIRFIDQLNKIDFVVQTIAKQLLRSSTSIGTNIIEAQAETSKRISIHLLNSALKSASETKFWLGLLKDSKKADKELTEKLEKETDEFAKLLGSNITVLRGKK